MQATSTQVSGESAGVFLNLASSWNEFPCYLNVLETTILIIDISL